MTWNLSHKLQIMASVGRVPSESTPAFPRVFPQPEQLCKSYSTTGDSSFAAPLGRSIIIYIQLVIKAQDLSRITCWKSFKTCHVKRFDPDSSHTELWLTGLKHPPSGSCHNTRQPVSAAVTLGIQCGCCMFHLDTH